MRNVLLSTPLFLLCIACNQSGQVNEPGTTTEEITDSTSLTTTDLSTPPCEPSGNMLEGNSLWIQSSKVIVSILADSSTYDEELGDSHRLLTVFDTEKCAEIHRALLPVNTAPDYPYELADISFHRAYQLIAIKGVDRIYCFDVKEKSLSKPLAPMYLEERFKEDAQSGTIEWLEVWENYILGYAIDYGPFSFKIDDNKEVTPFLPLIEYGTKEGYTGLFLCDVGNGRSQAILPVYDLDEREMELRPVFEQPRAIETAVRKAKLADHLFVLGKDQDNGTSLVINLTTAQLLELPNSVDINNRTAVEQWINNNS